MLFNSKKEKNSENVQLYEDNIEMKMYFPIFIENKHKKGK